MEAVFMEAVTMKAVTMEAVTMEAVTMKTVTMEVVTMEVVTMEAVARCYRNISTINCATFPPFTGSLVSLPSLVCGERVTLVYTTLHPMAATTDLMLCCNALILCRVVSWYSCQGGMTSWPS